MVNEKKYTPGYTTGYSPGYTPGYSPMWWEITVVLIGLLGLIWFMSCRYLAPSLENIKNLDAIERRELLNKVENGDLLFFSGTSQGERVIRFFHNSYYSHICMVFKDPNGALDNTPENTIFIWETDLGQRYKDGPRIMRLSEKLDRWKGSKIGMWKRYIPSDALGVDRPQTKDILAIAQTYLDSKKEMDIYMMSWFFSSWPNSWLFKTLKGNGVFCSELIVDTLQKLGIVSSTHHPSWYSPESFVRGEVPLIKGSYSFPVYFTF